MKLYGEVTATDSSVGSEAICHNKVIEELALPGQVVVGTDSHTCMAGALGCFAFGVGSTDMANAWFTRDVRVTVPETVRFVLTGALAPGVCAKDVMLHLLAQPFWQSGKGIGKVLEFAGEGTARYAARRARHAHQHGGRGGRLHRDHRGRRRGRSTTSCAARARRGDRARASSYRATRARTTSPPSRSISARSSRWSRCPAIRATASRSASSSKHAAGDVQIDIAYGGSCTGGKKADMDMYAAVLGAAVATRASASPRACTSTSSSARRTSAATPRRRATSTTFAAAGAELVDPSCGACIKAGPGVSFGPDEVTVSAINRNFPGRSGPGKVYLASPLVVAASAIAGRIVHPGSLEPA